MTLTVENLAAKKTELLKLAEDIMSRHVPEFKQERIPEHTRLLFSIDEQLVFDELGWSNGKLHDQFGKRAAAARWSELAGTAEDRARSVKLASTTQAALDKQGPAIKEKIADLNGQLVALQTARNDARKVVEDQATAVSRCRMYVPEHITERHNRAMKDLKREGADESDPRFAEADALRNYYVR